MPLIRATLVENAITPAKKQELISRLTDAVAFRGTPGIFMPV
jgi:phenylpyruvate tautomerase PptA (4-oxalocrotonate tautomerase family)